MNRLARYLTDVYARMETTGWRAGQTYFNVLLEHDPELAESVRGSTRDPFYQNDRIPAFLSRIAEEWA